MNFLVMGPWFHSQINRKGWTLGPLQWNGDTTRQYRHDVLLPFFTQYLVDGAPKADTPPVFVYNTGENHWDRFTRWPISCENGCPNKSRPLYFEADGKLSFDAAELQAAKSSPSICPILRSQCRFHRGPMSPPTRMRGAPGWFTINALSTAAPMCSRSSAIR